MNPNDGNKLSSLSAIQHHIHPKSENGIPRNSFVTTLPSAGCAKGRDTRSWRDFTQAFLAFALANLRFVQEYPPDILVTQAFLAFALRATLASARVVQKCPHGIFVNPLRCLSEASRR